MSEELTAFVAWCSTAGAILLYSVMCYRFLRKKLEKWISTETDKRLTNMEGWTKSQQEDIDIIFDERIILIKSIEAILKGLQESGTNSSAQKGLEDIHIYLLERAAAKKSRK